MRTPRFIMTTLMPAVMVAASWFGEAAASSITIEPTGPASYSVKAADLQESAGMDLSILYDAATLKDPKVTSGALISGALLVPNTVTPGSIRIGIVTGGVIKGTGEVVSITFTKAGNSPAPKPTLSSSLYSSSGTQLAVQSINTTSLPDKDKTAEDGSKTATGTGSGAAGVTSTAGGTGVVTATSGQSATQTSSTVGFVSSSQDISAKGDLLGGESRREDRHDEAAYRDVPAQPSAGSGGTTPASREPAAVVSETKTPAVRPVLKSNQNVLDLFRTYKDVRTLKRFSSLFDGIAVRVAGIVQTPAIAVTDGKTLVTVAIELASDAEPPSFSLRGANQKALRRVSDRKWEIDALPQKGKTDVRLSILLKGERAEISLVAVPPLGQAAARQVDALSAAAVDGLLAKPLKNNTPLYDLNSDGRQDYLDDYLLVAHWLLKQQRGAGGDVRKPAAAGK